MHWVSPFQAGVRPRQAARRAGSSSPGACAGELGRKPLIGLVALLSLCCGAGDGVRKADPAPAGGTPPGPEEVAVLQESEQDPMIPRPLGRGFLVWESNRDGGWGIWTRPLDGSKPRRLTPDEPGRHHCCPHISPDGTRVAYLSFGGRYDSYPKEGIEGELRLIEIDGGRTQTLAGRARAYRGNRAAVWRSAEELIYIDGQGRTLVTSPGGVQQVLTKAGEPRYGWLLDPTLRSATMGVDGFGRYDQARRRVAPRYPLRGCESYFTHDGRWGYWVAGAGGPIHRLDLTTGETAPILQKNDDRMPGRHGYAYFPMVSHDSLVFAFGASAGEHDHFESDYEIFLAEIDPRSLFLISDPVRYTFDPAVDRYPDVYLEPLKLGRHFGEAPFEVELSAPGGSGSWRWQLGDGSAERVGDSITHIFSGPGRYEIEARLGDRRAWGLAVVEESRPPAVVDLRTEDEGRRVVVLFDEEISLDGARFEFASGREIASAELGEGRTSLRLELGEPIRDPDRLRLEGISDRARAPNRVEPINLEVEPPSWPSRAEDLLFVWETYDAANLFPDPETGIEEAVLLQRRGRALLDHDFAMSLDGGWFLLDADKAAPVRRGAQRRNEITLELTLQPAPEGARREGTIVAMRGGGQQNFTLRQAGGELELSLRTGNRGPEANPVVRLGRVPPDRASHWAVTYRPGELVAYVDGERSFTSDSVQGDFYQWRDYPLTFGAGDGGREPWRGSLEGVAIYGRFLQAAEAAENHRRYRRKLERRPEVEQRRVRARLIGRSATPSLREISPYREALAVYEYQLVESLAGEAPPRQFRVAHWVILDGETQPVSGISEGEVRELLLEPFADNPQLDSVFLADDFATGGEGPLFYAAVH